MAVAVGNISSVSVNSASVEWLHTLGTGSDLELLIGLCLAAGVTASGGVVWDNDGVNEILTLLRRDNNAGAGVSEIWYRDDPSPATGSSNVTASVSAMARNIGGGITFTGAGTPDNAVGSTPDGVTSVSNTVAGLGADDFVFDCLRNNGGIFPNFGVDQTTRWILEIGGGGGEWGGGSTQDGVDGGVMSWSDISSDWAHTACRIPAAAGAPVSFPPVQPAMNRPLPHVRM